MPSVAETYILVGLRLEKKLGETLDHAQASLCFWHNIGTSAACKQDTSALLHDAEL